MLTIKLEGFEELKRQIAESPRKVEIAAQRAILKTANAVKDAEVAEIQRVFDRPTRWTIGAMKVKATSKFEVLAGIVDPEGFYKRAASYLGTQIGGGQRRTKAMEKALQQLGAMPAGWFTVPGEGAQLDSNGNMSVGQIRQILSWFNAAERWAGSMQNMSAERKAKLRAGTAKKTGFEYFIVMPDTRKNLKQPGIYQRFFFGSGKAIKPVLIYVKGARYQARFNFEKVANETVDAVMQPAFDEAIKAELLK